MCIDYVLYAAPAVVVYDNSRFTMNSMLVDLHVIEVCIAKKIFQTAELIDV
jgi:hypothetical protein